jgi:hypothetical protein
MHTGRRSTGTLLYSIFHPIDPSFLTTLQ